MRTMDSDAVNEELEQLRSAAEAAAGLLALTKHMPVPFEQRRAAVATWRQLRDALIAAGVEVPESTRPAEPWALVGYRELRNLRAQRDAVLAIHRRDDDLYDPPVCSSCRDESWPCPTARALGMTTTPGRSG